MSDETAENASARQLQRPVLVFDVNETLLDITTLEPLFDRLFGDPAVLREWFAQLVLYSQAITLAGNYTSFSALAAGVLKMTATIHNVTVVESDIDELSQRIATMPAHGDVAPALRRLQQAGFRMVTLTNSPPGDSPTPLEHAGIAEFFEQSFSVEAVRKFKPAAETYHHVAEQLGVTPASLCMVACHLWDTLGAQAAGCSAALLLRPNNAMLPAEVIPVPDMQCSDLMVFADQLIPASTSS